MAADEYALDLLYRLRERYGRRKDAGDPAASDILTAIERLIDEHEQRADDAARRPPGTSRGRIPPA